MALSRGLFYALKKQMELFFGQLKICPGGSTGTEFAKTFIENKNLDSFFDSVV